MNKRSKAILNEVFSNLSEYYVVLGAKSGNLFRRDLAARVSVPDTGNDQKDYEATRDQVEALMEYRKTVQFTLDVEFDASKTDHIRVRKALDVLLRASRSCTSLRTVQISPLDTRLQPMCPFGRRR